MESKKILKEMKYYFQASSIEEVAQKLGYSRKTASTWRTKGISQSAINKYQIIRLNNLNNENSALNINNIANQNGDFVVNGNNNIILDDKKPKDDLNSLIDYAKDTGKTTRENEPMAFEFYLKEVCDLLKEYGSFSLIWELRKKLLAIKELHKQQS